MTTTLVSAPVQEPQTAVPEVPEVIEVVVSLRHIQEGLNSNGERCAVALALRDIGFRNVEVGYSGVYIGSNWFCETPDDLEAWVRAFDDDKSKVAPERFLLRRAA